MEQQFQQAGVVSHDLSSGDFPIAGHADFIGNLFGGEGLLGFSHHGNFGNGVDPDGKVISHGFGPHVKGVTGREAPLFGRRGGQAGIADDVTGCKDMRDGRPKLSVDSQSSSVVGFESRDVQVQGFRCADPAH